jgi:hypothetical protein
MAKSRALPENSGPSAAQEILCLYAVSDIIKFSEDPDTGPWLNVLKHITKVNMYTAVLIMAIIICHF